MTEMDGASAEPEKRHKRDKHRKRDQVEEGESIPAGAEVEATEGDHARRKEKHRKRHHERADPQTAERQEEHRAVQLESPPPVELPAAVEALDSERRREKKEGQKEKKPKKHRAPCETDPLSAENSAEVPPTVLQQHGVPPDTVAEERHKHHKKSKHNRPAEAEETRLEDEGAVVEQAPEKPTHQRKRTRECDALDPDSLQSPAHDEHGPGAIGCEPVTLSAVAPIVSPSPTAALARAVLAQRATNGSASITSPFSGGYHAASLRSAQLIANIALTPTPPSKLKVALDQAERKGLGSVANRPSSDSVGARPTWSGVVFPQSPFPESVGRASTSSTAATAPRLSEGNSASNSLLPATPILGPRKPAKVVRLSRNDSDDED